jgi:hypothetical protein
MSGNLPTTPSSNNKVFTNFYKNDQSVSQNSNDAVIGYFQSLTGNKETGKTLATTVIATAVNQGIDPMELIDEFRSLNRQELNAYLTMFLNINRVGTSLLGISNSPEPNKYIIRSILP